MWFVSDNAGPAHPAVLEALARANAAMRPSYGADEAMARVTARLRAIFEAPEAAVFLVGHRHGGERAGARLPLPALGDGVRARTTPMSRRTSAARSASTPAARR